MIRRENGELLIPKAANFFQDMIRYSKDLIDFILLKYERVCHDLQDLKMIRKSR
jgi:hypothetical protein